jgi:hypothetical protein
VGVGGGGGGVSGVEGGLTFGCGWIMGKVNPTEPNTVCVLEASHRFDMRGLFP